MSVGSNYSNTAIPSFDTVAVLKTINIQSGELVNTEGYISSRDRGGCQYVIKTATQAAADGDTIDGYVNFSLNNTNVAIKQHQMGVSCATYAEMLALNPNAFPLGSVIKVVNTTYGGDFVVTTGSVTDDGGTKKSNATWSASTKYLQRKYNGSNVNVKWFGATSTSDDSLSFTNAILAGKKIYVPAGSYNISNVNLISNIEIYGDGLSSSIINVSAVGHYGFVCDSGSPLLANNLRNIKLTDIQLLGTVGTNGFSEFDALVSLSGVTDAIIRRCALNGFLGDGLLIASSNIALTERHNQRVKVIDCEFDGVNNDNRNAISIIDGESVKILRCTFKNCTRSNMPGAIDMEPDASTWPIIKNILIADNIFENIGGNVGAVSVQIPSTVLEDASNIKILRNTFTGVANLLAINTFRLPSTSTRENTITFRDNTANSGTGRPFLLFNANRCLLENNDIYNFESSALIGYTGATDASRDIEIIGNRFVRCGSSASSGVVIFKSDYVKFRRNKFIDCGNGAAGSNAIAFNTGTSSYIDFDDSNEFSSPTGKTLIAIQKEVGHTFTPSTNNFYNTILNSLPNYFQSYNTDAAQSWTPVLTGSTSGTLSGTGTLCKFGHIVTVYVEFAITTGTKPIGNYTITGLPVATSTNQISAAICSTDKVTFTTQPRVETRSSSTILDILQPVSNTNSVYLTDANFVNAGTMYIRFTLSYTS